MASNKDGITIRIGGKTVGVIRGTKLDVRRHSNGFLHTPPSLALAVQTVETARQAGVQTVAVTNLDSGSHYTISLSEFLKYSWHDSRGGFEPQLIVALDRFEKTPGIVTGDVDTAFAGYYSRATTTVQPESSERQLTLFSQ